MPAVSRHHFNDESPSGLNHVWLLHCSLKELTGIELIEGATHKKTVWDGLKHAAFAVVSHGTEDDPIFNYANPKALELFEMDLDTFTKLPSRMSAELPNREERAHLLDAVNTQGYIDNYTGIRISATGRRFFIKKAIVWNLLDEYDVYRGQAAMIPNWEYLSDLQTK